MDRASGRNNDRVLKGRDHRRGEGEHERSFAARAVCEDEEEQVNASHLPFCDRRREVETRCLRLLLLLLAAPRAAPLWSPTPTTAPAVDAVPTRLSKLREHVYGAEHVLTLTAEGADATGAVAICRWRFPRAPRRRPRRTRRTGPLARAYYRAGRSSTPPTTPMRGRAGVRAGRRHDRRAHAAPRARALAHAGRVRARGRRRDRCAPSKPGHEHRGGADERHWRNSRWCSCARTEAAPSIRCRSTAWALPRRSASPPARRSGMPAATWEARRAVAMPEVEGGSRTYAVDYNEFHGGVASHDSQSSKLHAASAPSMTPSIAKVGVP